MSKQSVPILSHAAYRVLRLVCERAGVYRCLEVVPGRVAGELGLEAWEVEQALSELDREGLLHLTGISNLVMVSMRSFKVLQEQPEPQPELAEPRLRLVS